MPREFNRLQLAKHISRRVAYSRNRVPEQHGDGFDVLGEHHLLQVAESLNRSGTHMPIGVFQHFGDRARVLSQYMDLELSQCIH